MKMLGHRSFTQGMMFSPTFKIPMPDNIKSNLLIRPKEFILSEFIKSEPSQSLTVFTYTIGSGFSCLVENSAKKCRGDVNLVFGLTENPKVDKISKQIYAILKNSKLTSLTLHFSKSSHIKLFQRDNYLLVGSQNFSMSSDIEKYSSDEIMMEYTEGGEDISRNVLNYLKSNDGSIESLNVYGKSEKEIESFLNICSDQNKTLERTMIATHKKDIVEHVFENFMIGLDDSLTIEEVFENKLEFISEFWEGTCQSFSQVIPLQGLVDHLEGIMHEAYGQHIILLEEIELNIYDKAEEMAQDTLCEDGYTDPDTGKAYNDSTTNKELNDLIESISDDLLQKNRNLEENFVNEVNSTLLILLEESLN
jgi:hypothetical protein